MTDRCCLIVGLQVSYGRVLTSRLHVAPEHFLVGAFCLVADRAWASVRGLLSGCMLAL